ncbi:MAG: anthranilate phosphoribosyltransferase [Acidobacteriia bacterium]|nr:anthranilate phosphoribosyltransferase [Terriglobia bacterium]
MQIREATHKLEQHQDLTRAEARAVMEALLSGSVPDAEIMALLIALRDKGERVEELVGFAEVMRARASAGLCQAGVNVNALAGSEPLLDTCGTGGDGQCTFNVSTATALVAAAAGVRVAKHGNRSISSRCGSADVLEALAVKIDLPFERIPECLEKVGMVFLFAPRLHLAMKHVMNARRALKTKTVFNLLGPLTNPLGASVQLVGVYDRARTEMMAQALAAVGTKRALVVASHDGIDEITTTGPTQVSESDGSSVRTRDITPEDFGLARAPVEALRGGDPETNAGLLGRVLAAERGPLQDLVLANASAALVAAGKAADFRGGVELARQALESGVARAKLQALVNFTRQYAP